MQVLDEIGVDVASQVCFLSTHGLQILSLNSDPTVSNSFVKMQLSSAPKGRIGATNKKVDNSQARYANEVTTDNTILFKIWSCVLTPFPFNLPKLIVVLQKCCGSCKKRGGTARILCRS